MAAQDCFVMPSNFSDSAKKERSQRAFCFVENAFSLALCVFSAEGTNLVLFL